MSNIFEDPNSNNKHIKNSGDSNDYTGSFSSHHGEFRSSVSLKFVDEDGRIVPNVGEDIIQSGVILNQLNKSNLSRKQRSWIDPLEPAIQNSFYEKDLKINRPDFESVERVYSVPETQLTGLFSNINNKKNNNTNNNNNIDNANTTTDTTSTINTTTTANITSISNNSNNNHHGILKSTDMHADTSTELSPKQQNAFNPLKSVSFVNNNVNEDENENNNNDNKHNEDEDDNDSVNHSGNDNSNSFRRTASFSKNDEDLELMSAEVSQNQPSKAGKKFGAWDGVFTGCILNIFGVIMFLRVGWIVGQAGVIGAIIIVLISSAVTFLTTLSMSAICTNGTIKSGGAYYIISRSLGPAIGGSVGLMFSLGNMVAVSLYLIGFAETLVENLGSPILTGNFVNDVRIWSNIVLCFELFLALIGLKYVVKANMGLLVLIIVTICCFFIGSLYQSSKNSDGEKVIYGIKGWGNGNLSDNMEAKYVDGYGFWSVLSIFFPAVTGIMAGANISGDLNDPSVDIPLGTLSAVILSTGTYSIMAVVVGAVVARSELIDNFLVMADVAVWDGVVLIGIYAATLSSGIAALVGAPRILQAVAQDNIIDLPIIKFFAVTDSEGNPIRGYFLSFLVAAGCNCIGELNFVAPLISEFFMIAYLMLNFSCFAMEISKTPNWRPNFKYFSKWGALAGFLLCLTVMFLIDYRYALATMIIGFGIFGYILIKDPPVEWGSAIASIYYYQINKGLLRLRKQRMHVKNWRPNILVLIKKLPMKSDINQSNLDQGNLNLILFAQTLKKAYAPLFFGTAIVVKDGSNKNENNKNGSDTNSQNLSMAESSKNSEKLAKTTAVNTLLNSTNNNVNNNNVMLSRQIEKDAFTESIRDTVNDGYLPSYLTHCKGFYNTILCENIRYGASNLMRSSGIGSMRPNTVLIGFLNNWQYKTKKELNEYVQILRDSLSARIGVIVACQGFENSINFGPVRMNSTHNLYAAQNGIVNDNNNNNSNNSDGVSNDGKIIDVWWLLDDGGLTVLVPHIMKQDEYWKGYKLRINLVMDKSDILNKGVQDIKLIESLINTKFRLSFEKEARMIYVEKSEPQDETVERYEKLLAEEGMTIKDVPRPNVVKRWLRLSELLKENSSDSAMVVVNLPLPSAKFDSRAYIALLSIISDQESMPPMLIMRGNGQSSLTYYSD